MKIQSWERGWEARPRGPRSPGVLHNFLTSRDKRRKTLLCTPAWKGCPLPVAEMRAGGTIETTWASDEYEKMTGFLKDKVASDNTCYFVKGHPAGGLVHNPFPALSLLGNRMPWVPILAPPARSQLAM